MKKHVRIMIPVLTILSLCLSSPLFASFNTGFENGWEDWTTDDPNIWEIGEPTAGPSSAHTGISVAGTILNGNYPHDTDSYLISPIIQVPSGRVELRFWQWYSYNEGDYGQIQVSEWNGSGWDPWIPLAIVAGPEHTLQTSGWSRAAVDLTNYSDKQVRIGFYHNASWHTRPTTDISLGWYIDDVEIVQVTTTWSGIQESFEAGWGDWNTDMGVWQIGEPLSGPTAAHNGTSVAGTNLSGNYPHDSDSRLISPMIGLPAVTGSERVELRFWQWYSYNEGDSGQIQVSEWNGSGWDPWIPLAIVAGPEHTLQTSGWSRAAVDLTNYSDKQIRIGFYHNASWHALPTVDNSLGWYIDDVEIVQVTTTWAGTQQSFEGGWGDWNTDMGVWQIGEPLSGPAAAHNGTSVAGTNLSGNYPHDSDSHLISPMIELPVVTGSESVELWFWQWYSYEQGDNGQVHISQWNGSGWNTWETLIFAANSQSSSNWSVTHVDLTAYSGKKVRIGFYHKASWAALPTADVSSGWYIDDVEIVKIINFWDGQQESFENGWGYWYADMGVWQIGEPLVGPSTAHHGTFLAGTVLNGNYPHDTDSHLISPMVELPSTGRIKLCFWQWYSYKAGDNGQIHISQWNGTGWDSWAPVAMAAGPENTLQTSNWSYTGVDLTAYAGKQIRIGFYHEASWYGYPLADVSSGWYIDQIEIVQILNTWDGQQESFEIGWGDWHTDMGVWQIGVPMAGPPGAHDGNSLAGTHLSGNYPHNTDSYLISPMIHLPTMPGGENIYLRYWQWYSYDRADYGQVHVSQWNGTGWDSWVSLGTYANSQSSSDWTQLNVDLTNYSGKQIRIGFYHQASWSTPPLSDVSTGWYIDQVTVDVPLYKAITILSPKAGEFIQSGDTYNIQWATSTNPNIISVDIEYSTNNGTLWNTIDTNVPSTGSYLWSTPLGVHSNECLVRISDYSDPGVYDISDFFIIFTCQKVILSDLNNDCYVNFKDLRIFAIEWLTCGNDFDPSCIFP